MTDLQIIETLEKQLQLLSERSEACSDGELGSISNVMLCISEYLVKTRKHVCRQELMVNPEAIAQAISRVVQEENRDMPGGTP